MIGRVTGFGSLLPPLRPDLRVQWIRQSLRVDARVQFRFQGMRHTGRVLELLKTAAVIQFQLRGVTRAEQVKYSSILRILGP
jgi:hypothetical protein